MLFGQRATIQKGEATKDRLSEQEIKNAVFFTRFTYVSKSYVLVRAWKKNDQATHLK